MTVDGRPAADPAPDRDLLGRCGAWLAADLRWLVVAALVVGSVLRLAVGLSPQLGRLDADHAVLYLMARQVAEGELPAFYWGQEYGGSPLPLVLGAVFLVTGSHLWLLNVAIALSATAVVVLTWRVGVALGSPRVGAVAAGLTAVGPPTAIYFGTASDGFYAVGTALSLAGLLVLLRTAERLTLAAAGLTGLLLGVAVWASPFSYLTVLPAALVALPLLRRTPLSALPLAAGGLLGALPVVVTTLRRGSAVPPGFLNPEPLDVRVERAVTGSWASAFTRFGPSEVPGWLVDRLAVTALLLAVVACVLAGVRVRRGHTELVTFALLLPVLLWVPLHVRAQLPSDPPASRYALPLLPFVALWGARWLQPRGRAVAAVLACAVYSSAGLWQAVGGFSAPGAVLHDRSYALLAAELDSRGRSAVWADYWISYRLTAETDERITAEPPSQPRRQEYADAAASAPATTVVVFAGLANDAAMAQAFAGDPGVVRVEVEQFAVYYGDRPLALPGFSGTVDVDRV